MHRVILLIGGNQGDRLKNIKEACCLIESKVGTIIKLSSLYESEPWGFTHAQNFINQVLEVETNLKVNKILNTSQNIESLLGRKAKTNLGYEGRTMDIDILFFNDEQINTPNLSVPHQHLHKRKFTLLPLAEKWSQLLHPSLKKEINLLLNECIDEGWVKKLII